MTLGQVALIVIVAGVAYELLRWVIRRTGASVKLGRPTPESARVRPPPPPPAKPVQEMSDAELEDEINDPPPPGVR